MTTPENTADREILLSRVLHAPRELVWEAMTDPQQVVHWWGPRGFSTTIEKMEVRPGGTWKHVMHGPDGTDYPNKSTFTEVTKPERLVFVHTGAKEGGPGANFVATWTFAVVDEDKTKVTIHMVFPTAEERDTVVKTYGAIEGGQQTLERFGEFVLGGPIIVERMLNAPVEVVWKAITDSEQMKEWYFTLPGFKAEVGHENEFTVEHDGKRFRHLLKVTEAVPNRKLAYTWSYDTYAGQSLVTFELFPEEGKTRLKLTHTGLDTFDPAKHPELARKNFRRGWTSLIGSDLPGFLQKTEGK